jgi:hypothetical protein
VQVIVDHPVDRLVIEDPLPAGLEAVDEALRTSSTPILAKSDSWQIENQQIYADRVTAYAEHLEPGIYEMHYLARAVTPGSYRWPSARAYLRDAPEEFGRTAFAAALLGGQRVLKRRVRADQDLGDVVRDGLPAEALRVLANGTHTSVSFLIDTAGLNRRWPEGSDRLTRLPEPQRMRPE